MIKETIDKFGKLNILVNNAAVFPGCNAINMTEEIWDETFDVDIKGSFFFAKFAVEQMIVQGNGGKIINFLCSLTSKMQ